MFDSLAIGMRYKPAEGETMVRDHKPDQWAINVGYLGMKFGIVPLFGLLTGYCLYLALAWLGPNVFIPWQNQFLGNGEAQQNLIKATLYQSQAWEARAVREGLLLDQAKQTADYFVQIHKDLIYIRKRLEKEGE